MRLWLEFPHRLACPATRPIGAAVLAIWLALSLVSGCQKGPGAAPKTPSHGAARQVEPDQVATVALRSWPEVVHLQGSLIGDEHAVVGTKVAGLVQQVFVDLGSVVEPGDPLAALVDNEFELRLTQAEAQLDQARAHLGLKPNDSDDTLDRLQAPTVRQARAILEEARSSVDRLRALSRLGSNLISAEELQQREAALSVAEAQYASALNSVDQQIAQLAVHRADIGLARQARADARIVAPFAGVVEMRYVAPGVYVSPGQPVATIVRTDPLRFQAGVPEREALRIKLGQAIRIRVPGEIEPREAVISRISPSVNPNSRALAIEADLANADGALRAGLFAEAEVIVDDDSQTLAVPRTAVFEFAGVEKVWIVLDDGSVVERQVRTGRRGQRLIEVLDGLSEGAAIVADASRSGREADELETSTATTPSPPSLPATAAETPPDNVTGGGSLPGAARVVPATAAAR